MVNFSVGAVVNFSIDVCTLPVRFAMEAAGGLAYATWVWRQQESTGDTQKALERVKRLTVGARSPVELPWGGPTTHRSVNVLDFIDRLETTGYPGARADYDFLSESCHPSFLQLTAWNLVSAPASNFRNPLLDSRILSQLERTVAILERVVGFAISESEDLLGTLLPVVEEDASQHDELPDSGCDSG